MSRTLRFVITTTILFFGVLAFVSAYAQESEPVPPGLALKQDAVEYSKAYGVTLDEAIRRLELQGMIGVMNYLLTTNEQETFGGLWIEHIPEFRVIVKFTHNGQKIIEPYLNESIADVIELQAASVPLTELQSTHRRAMELVHPLDIPVDSALNIRKAQVELFVVKRSEFDTELLVRNIQLPNHTKVITVERLSELATNIYGGLMLTYAPNSQENYCTSGFSVQHYERDLGITTAAHCGGKPDPIFEPEVPLYYNGMALPLPSGQKFEHHYDIQWHKTTNFTARSWVYDKVSPVRPIIGIQSVQYQSNGDWVCKYGRTSEYTCGEIVSKEATVWLVPYSERTFIKVTNPDGTSVAAEGDSGGPWFNGGLAYGTTVASNSAGAGFYMPIDYIDALSVNVYTGKETYLPDVRNSNGWLSNITIRYTGSLARSVTTVYLDNSGNYVPASKDECFLGQNQSCTVTPPANFEGSAVIDGSDDLSVVVYTDGAARGSLDNGFAPQLGGVGDATFEQAGTVLYAPAFYKNSWGINSSVSIVNVGSVPTTVNVEFIGRTTTDGNFAHNISNIPAGGRVTVNGGHIQNGGAPWVGSLRLTSTGVGSSPAQPIVAMVNDDTSANPVYSRSYNATKFGSPLVYVPAAYRNQWGFNTGLVVQNLGTSTTNVTLTFCPRLVVNLSNECHPFTINNLEPGKAQGVLLSNLSFLSNGWTGSVKLQTTTSGVPIAVAVTNSNNVGGYNFSATGRGGRTVFLPYAARNANGISTGYTVRNITGGNITVQANFYNTSGTLRHTYSFDLGPAQVKGFAQILDGAFTQHESWQGSIVLQATGDIVAMMRADDGDAVSAYNGIVR